MLFGYIVEKYMDTSVHKKTILFLLIFSSLYANTSVIIDPLFSQKEKQYLQSKKEIKMCIDPNWMPFEAIKDGEHIGMTKEYFNLIEKILSTKITLIDTKSWTESIEYAKMRECDIFSLAMETPNRKKYMNFTKPYLEVPTVITTQLTKPFMDDVENYLRYSLGITKGFAMIEVLKEEYPHIKLVEFDSLEDGLNAVRRGEIYGYIDNLISSGYAIQKNYIGELKIVGKFNYTWNLSIGVRNDDIQLLSIFNKAIDSIKNDQYRKIINKWLSVQYEKSIDFSSIWEIVVFISALILFLIYRQYELRKYTRVLEEKEKQLKILSTTDALTGLHNRRYFDSIMHDEFSRAMRKGDSLVFAMFDIDNFKKYNDIYGHQLGDEVIKKVAAVLEKYSRRFGDYAFRIGGEEFALILQNQKNEDMSVFFDKILKEIEWFNVEHSGNSEYNVVTVSAGINHIEKIEKLDLEKIYRETDKLLYEAKNKGRNQVSYKVTNI